MKEKNEEEKDSGKKKGEAPKTPNEDFYFDLADKSKEYLNLSMKDEDFGHSANILQKLHLRNHTNASKETIHEMYRAEEEIYPNETDFISEEDEFIFNEVKNAVLEYDIHNLRSNLQFISKNVSAHKYTFEDIEEFIEGGLDRELNLTIQAEAVNNLNLADEIRLFEEVDRAIAEKDVMQFRAKLIEICEKESSHSRSIEEIDDYLSNELEEVEKDAFEYEMQHNPDLSRDVIMHQEIDDAIAEKDIMMLRENLTRIDNSQREDEALQKRGITSPVRRKFIWYAAASIVLLISFNFAIRNQVSSNKELYKEYFQPFDSNLGATRSGSDVSASILNNALDKINQKDYESALNLLSTILKDDPDNAVGNFYTGSIQQIRGNYEEAIRSFSAVIKQDDNLFVEQSEWYIGLCYLNRNEHEKALLQFKKIVEQKGYYQKKSEEILARLD